MHQVIYLIVDIKNKNLLDSTSKNEEKVSFLKKLDYTNTIETAISINWIFLLIVIASGLVNSEYFYNPITIAYYGLYVFTFLFAVIYTCCNLTNNSITFKTPILLFGLWCFYILAHYFTNTATLTISIYSIALYFLLLKASSLFSNPGFNFKLFFIGIIGIATLESLCCLFQFFGLLKSHNMLFAVTGSWNNPNVTAIFLALTVPVFLFLFKSKYKKIVLIGFILLLIALLLLKCRAAFIGTVLSVMVFYGFEYRIIDWIKNKKNRTSAKALLIIGLLIIIPVTSHLYNAKKASADGRKFIWKVSAIMATEKPITGYGYGYFEKEYNLYQANYIQKGKATHEELENAAPVIMPHNELLQNAVEGGIIGLVLIVLFFGSLLITIKEKNRTYHNEFILQENVEIISKTKNSHFNLSHAGIVAFIGMSMVNSTIQIVPVMCMMIIYASIICSTLKPLQLPIKFSFIEKSKAISVLNKSIIISSSLYLFYLLFGIAIADRQNKKAKLLKEAGHYEQALKIMPYLKPQLKENSDYWKNYGLLYFRTQSFQQAMTCFKKAQTLSSLPEVYLGAGKSYEKLQQYPQAIQEYETLIALYPSKFSYRMMLLETYLKNKNNAAAIALAQEIIQIKPKTPSEKANQYKKMCWVLLKKLGIQKTSRKHFNSNDNIKFKSFN